MRWEYTVLFVDNCEWLRQLEKRLNELGEKGWELVAYSSVNDYAILKRPLETTRA